LPLVDGQTLASGGGINSIWNLPTGLYILSGHSGWIYAIAMPDGQTLAGSADKTIKLWNLRTGDHSKPFLVMQIQFGRWPDGQTLASSSSDKNQAVEPA